MDQNGHMDRVHLVSTGQQCAGHDCFHLSIIDLYFLEYFPDYTLHYSGKLYTHPQTWLLFATVANFRS